MTSSLDMLYVLGTGNADGRGDEDNIYLLQNARQRFIFLLICESSNAGLSWHYPDIIKSNERMDSHGYTVLFSVRKPGWTVGLTNRSLTTSRLIFSTICSQSYTSHTGNKARSTGQTSNLFILYNFILLFFHTTPPLTWSQYFDYELKQLIRHNAESAGPQRGPTKVSIDT